MAKFLPISLAALATVTLLAGTAVLAQPAPEPGRSLTRADAETRAAEAFERMDANGDGQLSPADRDDFTRERFDAADTDGNGQLNFAEVGAMREQRGDRREARGEQMGMGPMRGMRGPGPEGMGPEGMGPMARSPMRGQMLEGADADNSGTVSQTEFASSALARFDRADANSDGTITADERRAQRGMGRGMGPGMGPGMERGDRRGPPPPRG